MRKIHKMKKVFFTLVLAGVFCTYAQTKKQLTVEVSGIDTTSKGNLSLGIFSEQQSIANNGKVFGKTTPITGKSIPVTAKKMKTHFLLPKGKYAVAIFQDENKNGKMDTDIFGIPKEPYAFSKNAKATFGAPKFKKASFSVTNDTLIRIDL